MPSKETLRVKITAEFEIEFNLPLSIKLQHIPKYITLFALKLSLEQMELGIRVQILDKVVCVSLVINALEKGKNPSLLPPTIRK